MCTLKLLRDAEQAATAAAKAMEAPVPIRLTAKEAQTHELSFVAHSFVSGSKNCKLHLDRVRITYANFVVSYM